MNILHVLSQTQPTGAETYANTLAAKQKEQGHEVFIVSDKCHFPTVARFFSQPISVRSYLQRFKNIRYLKRFISENEITIVHAHSRAASWVSYFATKGSMVPLVSTIHGRQHLHRTIRKQDIYGTRVIAVCANVREHLINEFGISAAKISSIPNLLEFPETTIIHPSTPTIALLGRTTGPKGLRTGEFVLKALPALLKTHPGLKVIFAGGSFDKLNVPIREAIEHLNQRYPGACDIRGFVSQQDLSQIIQNATGVIGSGRIAIEALASGTPVFALGESSYDGLVTESNFPICAASNFGDMSSSASMAEMDFGKITNDLDNFLTNQALWRNNPSLIAIVRKKYDATIIAKEIEALYSSSLVESAHPAHIPALMYHKVTQAPLASKHRIFVTKDTFQKHMEFLKNNGFTPITFQMYKNFRQYPERMPKKPIFITFDDGYRNNYELALPILKHFAFPAVIFAMGNESLRRNEWDVQTGEAPEALMTTEELREMQKNGIEIGAHSLSHRDLTTLSLEEAREEIVQSKASLEERLGTEICSFAYPFGFYNNHIKALVREAGFDFAVATDTGALLLEEDPFAIFRVSIFPEDTKFRLWKKTSPWYRRYYRFKRGK